MNFGVRKDPPHKGEKEVPVGGPDCLSGLTFVISGTLDREILRVEYLTLLLKLLTWPLWKLPKDDALEKVVKFLNMYSISREDFDTIVVLSKVQGHPNPLDGIQPAVGPALTKAFNKGSKTRMVRAADLVMLPGVKKAPKKRIAAILEPSDDGLVNGGSTLAEGEEDNSSDTDELGGSANAEKLQMELESLISKGMQVELDLKGRGNSSAKKTPAGRGKGGFGSLEKKGDRDWYQEKEMRYGEISEFCSWNFGNC